MKKAFSLTEMIVVYAIVGFLTAAALFSLNYISPKEKEAAGRRITSALCWLREYAEAKGDLVRAVRADFVADSNDEEDYIEFYEYLTGASDWSAIPLKSVEYLNNDGARITGISTEAIADVSLILINKVEDNSLFKNAMPLDFSTFESFDSPALPWEIEVDGDIKVRVNELGYIKYVQ